MEEEKDQLIKRVERLKKRVSQAAAGGPFHSCNIWKALGSTEE